MKRSVSKKKKSPVKLAKSVKQKARKKTNTKKTAQNTVRFFIEKDISNGPKIEERIIKDMFNFEKKEKQKSFVPNFLKPGNSIEYIDELLDEAEILEEETVSFDKKTMTLKVEQEKKIDPIEKIIYDDVIMSETLRNNNNFNIKLSDTETQLNKSKFLQKKSQHVVNLKNANVNHIYPENNFKFELPQKRTIGAVSGVYMKEMLRIASKSKTFKIINFIGEGFVNFFYYIFLIIFFIPKVFFDLFIESVLFVNSLGRGFVNFFIKNPKKSIKVDLGDNLKRTKSKIFSLNPKMLFEKGAWTNYRRAFSFVIVSFVVVFIIHSFSFINMIGDAKGRVLGISEQAYGYFGNGIESIMNSDFGSAKNDFGSANSKFIEAQNEISKYNIIFIEIAKLIPEQGKKLDSGIKLLEAGKLFSNAANHISAALEKKDNISITDKIKIISSNLKQTKDELKLASAKIQDVDPRSIPEEYRNQFVAIKDGIPKISENLDGLVALMDVSVNILADDTMKRYLFIFQNSNELRPTGGFMGSMAIVDMQEGLITGMKVPGGGPYDYKAGFYENIASPKPLWLINPNWYFWDTLWWPNFPTSADMMLKYFYKSGGPTVDGVIAVNVGVMEKLLKVTGPIYLEKYNLEINSENFAKEVQTEVEINYDREKNQPKEIIQDLIPKLMDKVFGNKDIDYLEILKVFEDSVLDKDIQMYFTDPYLEENIKKFGWAGELKDVSKDYLSVVNTNIGGGKTDEFIKQIINHDVNILSNGKIVDTLKIERNYISQENNIFATAKNKNYIRIYVPMGSKIIEASGFEKFPEEGYVKPTTGSTEDEDFLKIEGRYVVDEESGAKINNTFNKTVFSGWQEINPGEKKEIYIKYELPFQLNFNKNTSWISDLFFKGDNSLNFDNYSVYYQKQSGITSELNTNYHWSSGLHLTWANFKEPKSTTQFNKDIIRGLIITK